MRSDRKHTMAERARRGLAVDEIDHTPEVSIAVKATPTMRAVIGTQHPATADQATNLGRVGGHVLRPYVRIFGLAPNSESTTPAGLWLGTLGCQN